MSNILFSMFPVRGIWTQITQIQDRMDFWGRVLQEKLKYYDKRGVRSHFHLGASNIILLTTKITFVGSSSIIEISGSMEDSQEPGHMSE